MNLAQKSLGRTFFSICIYSLVLGSCTPATKEKETQEDETSVLAGAQPGAETQIGPSVPVSDAAAVAEAKALLTFSVIAGTNPDPDAVTSDLNLVATHGNNVAISWSSSYAQTVDDAGFVSRPLFVDGDQPVTLTATLVRGLAQEQAAISITVLKIPPTDEEAITAVYHELSDTAILGANSSLDTVKSDLTLPAEGSYDTVISWTSGNTAITDDGKVTRPLHAASDESGLLSAVISRGGLGSVKNFSTTVPKIQDLLITEVAPGEFADDGWVELFNSSDGPLDLSTFSWRACDWPCNAGVSGAFPSLTLQVGDFVLIHATNTSSSYTGASDIYLAGWYPRSNRGIFEILSAGATVDFVRWDNGSTAPTLGPTSASYDGSSTLSHATKGTSLARPYPMSDSDRHTDWQMMSHATPGGTNGTGAAAGSDADGDGLTDDYETTTSLTDPFNADTDGDWFSDGQEIHGFAGIDLAALGANPLVRDIFVEIDYMAQPAGITNNLNDTTEPNTDPLALRRAAIDKVVAVFNDYDPVAAGDSNPHPIKLHVDVGDLFDMSAGIDASDYDLGGGGSIPFYRCVYLGEDGTHTPSNCGDLYKFKQDHFDIARRFVFHYFIVGWSQMTDGSVGPSGLAELFGNDGLMTIGSWNTLDAPADEQAIINYQAATLLHELGHNLGLNHGGNEASNYKPNYVSSMNYLYQLEGLDDDDNGDVFYYAVPEDHSHPLFGGFDNSPTSASAKIGFSHGNRTDLDETALAEQSGWLGINIDFNADSSYSASTIQHNIQPPVLSGNTSNTDVHKDHNDWRNLKLNFQTALQTDWHGYNPFQPSSDHQQLSTPCAKLVR